MSNFFNFLSDKEVESLIFADRYFLCSKSNDELKIIFKNWQRQIYHFEKIYIDKSVDAIFLQSLTRSDYDFLFSKIIESSGIKNYYYYKPNMNDAGELNFDAIRFLNDNYKIFRRIPESNILIKSCLALRLCLYGFIAERLGTIKTRCAVFFSDMQSMEYLASKYFNSISVKTVTAQHGLYVEYEGIDTVNVVNYLNQASNYFLAWGENTKSLIGKYHPSTTVVTCGKPDVGAVEKIDFDSGILIIFDQEIFRETNILMYKAVNEFACSHGIPVKVKFHPHNNIQAYKKIFPNIESVDAVEISYFIVGHSSSLLFQLQRQGAKVSQFISTVPTIELSNDYRFNDSLSFGKLYLFLKGKAVDKKKIPTNLIRYIGEESKIQYYYFFSELLNNKKKAPFISIIIPCYNSAKTILKCIASLVEQTFSDFEILIIDGCSSDDTIQLVNSIYETDERVKVFSGPDSGIYDAMNKGVAYTKGAWVYFLGSDDTLHDSRVLEVINQEISSTSADFLYGNVLVVGDVKWAKDGTLYDGPFDDKKIGEKNICHQAIFYKKELFEQHGYFDTKFPVCADWDINLRFWPHARKVFVPITISKFQSGGASTSASDPEFGKIFKKRVTSMLSEINREKV